MANSYPASGQVILDDLKVCTSARLQPHFVSYGEHMFMNLESAHNNSYLPVVTFSRAGCTLGAIGLDRASNSDSLGNYAESEMVIGTRANTPTSIQTNGVRRINITNDGRIGIGSTNFTLGGFNAKMLIKQTSNGDWTGLQISDAADENVINFGYNGTDFLISQSWRQGGGPIKNLKIGLGCQLFLRNDGNVGIGTTGPSTKLHIINKIDRAYTSNSFNDTSHALHIDFCNQNQRAGLIRWTSHGNLENSFGVVQVGCAAAGCGQGDFVFQAYKEAGGAGYNELMRLTNGGRVGIGTNTPSSKLDVSGADGRIQSRVDSSDGSTINVRPNAGKCGWISYTEDAVADRWGIGVKNGDAKLYFASGNVGSGGGTTRMVLDGSGYLGVGTTTPCTFLVIKGGAGSAKTDLLSISTADGAGSQPAMRFDTIEFNSNVLGRISTCDLGVYSSAMIFEAAGCKGGGSSDTTEIMRLVGSTGNVGMGITSPSYKLHVNGTFYAAGSSIEYKQGICNYNTDSCLFMCLKPVTYQYKDEYTHLGKELKSETQIGLIAEDVADVYPELAILVNEDEQKVVRNVDYEKLSIILLSEVQKLRKEVDNLKNNK